MAMNHDDDLDRIAAELDAPLLSASRVRAGSGLEGWLRVIAERQASDLLLVAGEPPTLRINGRLHRTDSSRVDGIDVEEMVLPELPVHAQNHYRERGTADA